MNHSTNKSAHSVTRHLLCFFICCEVSIVVLNTTSLQECNTFRYPSFSVGSLVSWPLENKLFEVVIVMALYCQFRIFLSPQCNWIIVQFIRSVVSNSATPWIAAHQASLSITNSQSSLRLTSIETVMPCSHLILGCPLLHLPPIPPSISLFQRVNSSHEVAKVLEFQL